MTTDQVLRSPFSIGSFVLGNFAAAWGFVVAPIYLVGFGLLLPYVLHSSGAGILPPELPAIGVILAVLGLLLAHPEDRRGRTPSRIGLALNGVPLALAVALGCLRAAG